MFGRSERKTPFQREQNQKLENLRDDCIALFINSGLTQKQIHERGGPTPTTISKWLYGETHFPTLRIHRSIPPCAWSRADAQSPPCHLNKQHSS
jgi:hypothetical protein